MADTWKYPKDRYDLTVDWSGSGVLPIGATSITAIEVIVKNGLGADVSGSMLINAGIDGLTTWGQVQSGMSGALYTGIHRATFNNGQTLEKYLTLEIRNPWTAYLGRVFKYPNDVFSIPIQWEGRLPRGATALAALALAAYAAGDVDETANYIDYGLALGTYSIARIFGGAGSDQRLLEFAQAFDNGRLLHDYLLLSVETPPA